MSRILVLGGTGAMGKDLVSLLAADGFDVCVTSRICRPSMPNCRFLHGDALDDAFLDKILTTRWDVIVDFMSYKTAAFQRRVLNLLRATSKYVFISSARVYADSNSKLTEDSPRLLDISNDLEFLSTDDYALAKARQEDLLRASGYQNWLIVRPYITYSDQRLQLGTMEKEAWLYRALRGRTIVFPEEMSHRMTTLSLGSDVALSIKILIEKPELFGEIFNVCTNHSVSWLEILNIYRDSIESTVSGKVKIKFTDLSTFSKFRSAKYQILYDRMYNRVFSNAKLAGLMDTDNFSNVNDGLRKCMKNFFNSPRFGRINWQSEALIDQVTNEFTSPTEISGVRNSLKYLAYRALPSKYFSRVK